MAPTLSIASYEGNRATIRDVKDKILIVYFTKMEIFSMKKIIVIIVFIRGLYGWLMKFRGSEPVAKR